MGLCEHCAFMNKKYDAFRQSFNDILEDGKSVEYHYCDMYDDHIPREIYDGNAKCEFYEEQNKGN